LMIAVVTCDIISSRLYPVAQRKLIDSALRDAFAEVCATIPLAHADFFSFSIIQGDEFQFSLESPEYFYHVILLLRAKLSLCPVIPVPLFRAGIGFGQRSIEGKTSYQMDGSAYHNSRRAIDKFSESGNKKRLSLCSADDRLLSETINAILAFADNLESHWTLPQRRNIMHKISGRTNTDIAVLQHVSRQNVGKSLKSAGWELIEETLNCFVILAQVPGGFTHVNQ